MIQSKIYVSVDIGSSTVKVIMAEMTGGDVHVLGVGEVRSSGIRKGTIVDIDATVQSIQEAVQEVERVTEIPVRDVIVGIPANGVQLQQTKGVVAVSGEGREITTDDLDHVLESAETMSVSPDRSIVTFVPHEFIVDKHSGIKDPRRMLGVRLEVDGVLFTSPRTLVHNINKCIVRSGLQLIGMYIQPLAAGTFALTEEEKLHGTALLDIGASATTLAVFKDGEMIDAAVIPIGGDHITRDLSIVLKTPLEEAERIKRFYGHAYYDDASNEIFQVPMIGSDAMAEYSQKYVAEIIGARLEELFELILEELYHMGIKDLPGGFVFTGGTTKVEGLLPLARDVFQTLVRIHIPRWISVREPMYTTALGLIQYAYKEDAFFHRDGEEPMSRVEEHYEEEAMYEEEEFDELERRSEQKKPSLWQRAKKVFDGFFE